MPRVPKLTPELQAEVCTLMSIGCSRRAAARMVGVAESTIRHTAQRDAGFAERFRKAELRAEAVLMRNIVAASEKHWRAGAWLLERRHVDEYGARKPGVVSSADLDEVVGTITQIILESVASADDRRNVHRQLAALQTDIREADEPWNGIVPRHVNRERAATARRRERRRATNDAGPRPGDDPCPPSDDRPGPKNDPIPAADDLRRLTGGGTQAADDSRSAPQRSEPRP